MADKVLLKDQLFTPERINSLAQDIKKAYPVFDSRGFTKTVLGKFPELELKARIAWMSETLREYLPEDYDQAIKILLDSLPPLGGDDFGAFTYAAHSDFVAKYGCNERDLKVSLVALKEMTKHFSAEDAIRYFINAFPEQTFAEILKWSKDSDYRVRRLASEGTRPILPWSPRITTPPEAAIPILDNLLSDDYRFVTRSVANHLNDISRTNPELVLATLGRWRDSGKQNPKEMDYIINQSLRTLIKNGHLATFAFLNVSTDAKVKVSDLHIKTNPIAIGEFLEFAFTLTAEKDEQLIVDYILHFPNKAGIGHNRKVFKLKQVTPAKDQRLTLTKRQPMRQMTTRKLYPGKCKLEIQVNAKKLAEAGFDIVR